jgi:hypothetical protein
MLSRVIHIIQNAQEIKNDSVASETLTDVFLMTQSTKPRLQYNTVIFFIAICYKIAVKLVPTQKRFLNRGPACVVRLVNKLLPVVTILPSLKAVRIQGVWD